MTEKIQKILNLFRGPRVVALSTPLVQNMPDITLSLMVFEKQHFSFPPKFKMEAEFWTSLNFSEDRVE